MKEGDLFAFIFDKFYVNDRSMGVIPAITRTAGADTLRVRYAEVTRKAAVRWTE